MDEKIKEYLYDNLDTVRQMISDCSCWDGSLQEYEYYENGEWFFRDFFSDAWQAVEYVCNGEYNSNDDYVQFDYNCLNSYSEDEVNDTLRDNLEEIFERWYEMYEDGNVDYQYLDSEFQELIDEYQEKECEENGEDE